MTLFRSESPDGARRQGFAAQQFLPDLCHFGQNRRAVGSSQPGTRRTRMRKRMAAMWGLVGVVVIVAGGFGLWLATLPSDVAASPPPVPASEPAAKLEAPTPPPRPPPTVGRPENTR